MQDLRSRVKWTAADPRRAKKKTDEYLCLGNSQLFLHETMAKAGDLVDVRFGEIRTSRTNEKKTVLE